MALQELNLEALGKTSLNGLFSEALTAVEASLEKDKDVDGERKITIQLSFQPNEHGYIHVGMSVKTSTPNRQVKTIASLNDSVLHIDTISNDVRQPDLYDQENDKIVDFKKAAEGRA